MFNVAILTPILQTLMTTTAQRLAEEVGLNRRRDAKLTGPSLLAALVFGSLKRRRPALEDLAQPLAVSRQALDQRLEQGRTAAFFRRVLAEAVNQALAPSASLAPLLDRFRGVFLDDCTSAALPDEAAADFPGTGGDPGGDADARHKFLVRWEIQKGVIHHIGVHPGRVADHDALEQAKPLPEGALHLADLGFADFDRLRQESDAGVYWITRLPAQTRLYPTGDKDLPLAEALRAWRLAGRKELAVAASVGNKDRAEGRLVAFACPPDVVARRLAKLEANARHRGRTASARQREMCHWTVLFTNVPEGWMTAEQLWTVYRLRWQIELLFKRFKSEGGLGDTASQKRYRVESEWYARLLAQVIRTWTHLLHGGPLRDVNPVQLGRVIADHAERIAAALRCGRGLKGALDALAKALGQVRSRTARKKGRTAAGTLAHLDETAVSS